MRNHRLRPAHPCLILAVALSAGACGAPGDTTSDAGEPADRAPADQAPAEDALVLELLSRVSEAEQKLAALADEFTQELYDWRPAEGVRSAAEVFMHVATINFAFPLIVGHEPPASTGLTMENLQTAAPAYETSLTGKDEVRPQLSDSFDNLRAAVSASDPERQVEVFGQTSTLRAFWISHLTHIHEHLGQLVAYSRVNGVAPPWSQ